MNAFHRGRRLRWTPELRTLVRETPPLLSEDLIMPYFVVETAACKSWKSRWPRPWIRASRP